jgi:cation transporter-like permease
MSMNADENQRLSDISLVAERSILRNNTVQQRNIIKYLTDRKYTLLLCIIFFNLSVIGFFVGTLEDFDSANNIIRVFVITTISLNAMILLHTIYITIFTNIYTYATKIKSQMCLITIIFIFALINIIIFGPVAIYYAYQINHKFKKILILIDIIEMSNLLV